MASPAPAGNPSLPLAYRRQTGGFHPLPAWSNWFLELGSAAASNVPLNRRRLVLAVSVPCRAYASVFVALATILGRVALKPNAADSEAYFHFLCSQPLNTRVIILREVNGRLRRFDGITKGCGEDRWGKFISVLFRTTKSLNEYASIRPEHCRQVLVAAESDDESTTRELVKNQRGFSVIKSLNFFESLVASECQVDFLTASRLDCLLVGNHARINEEMGAELSILHSHGATGTLYDIIRPRNLPAYSSSYRSLICSSEKKSFPDVNGASPCCAIFDTANGFLKWGHQPLSRCCVVILDRSEPHYALAMENLNSRYLQRLPDPEADGFPVTTRPAGTEVLRFVERTND